MQYVVVKLAQTNGSTEMHCVDHGKLASAHSRASIMANFIKATIVMSLCATEGSTENSNGNDCNVSLQNILMPT